MKKKYEKMAIKDYHIENSSPILAGSVETVNKEFKGHTDKYETETFSWDNITFE